MEKIPEIVPNLESIIELYFESCYYPQVPEWFEKLENLEILCLHPGLNLSEADQIGKLRKIQFLSLVGNPVDYIPDFVYELPNLEYLIAPQEEESFITKDLLKLKKLNFLFIPGYADDGLDLNDIGEYLSRKDKY